MQRINFRNSYYLVVLILVPSIWCCNSNQGVVKTKNGEEVKSTYKLRCTPPAKTYTKGLETKLDASIDSLSSLPKAKLEASLETTVVKLTQYSSEGLDRDLFYFRMCEMLNNNRDLDQTERTNIMKTVISKFDEIVKSKNQN